MHRIGIVGSGPAAFYTALKLLKSSPAVKVDVFEKLPVPFGLVRYGVAPDHPEVKNVINTFNQVARHENFRFFGNVTIGQDISIKEMTEIYSGIVLAYGAAVDKRLDIEGEDLPGVYSASDIVGWYNGLPGQDALNPDLSGEEAAIIGHGNVALDIARILLSPIDLLKKTDIPEHVLERLAASKIRRIHLIGRRGPLQVAFTIKEFRELTRIDGVSSEILVPDDQIDASPESLDELPRPRRRLTDLILEVAKRASSATERGWTMHFLRSCRGVLSSSVSGGRVSGLRLGVNRLQGDGSVIDTGESVALPCQMVVRSIGFRSVRIDPDIPFDSRRSVIPNIRGRVVTEDSLLSRSPSRSPPSSSRLYCVGWIKRGPVGVIINTLADAEETSETIVEDLRGARPSGERCRDVDALLRSKGIRSVSFSDWEAIDRLETTLGHSRGKPREKLTNLRRLLDAVDDGKEKI